jgi:hypothetical protein
MWIKTLCAVAFFANCGNAAIVFNAQSQPTSITDLTIGGVVYTASIEYGGSFDDHFADFASPSPVPTFWDDSASSVSAVTAIAASLNSANTLPDTSTMLVVPVSSGTWFLGDYVEAVVAEFSVGGSSYSHSTGADGIRLDPHDPAGNFGWVTLVRVPEPNAFIIAAFVLCAFGSTSRALGRNRHTFG